MGKLYTESERNRDKLSAALARLAKGRKFNRAERMELERMALAWERTVHKKAPARPSTRGG